MYLFYSERKVYGNVLSWRCNVLQATALFLVSTFNEGCRGVRNKDIKAIADKALSFSRLFSLSVKSLSTLTCYVGYIKCTCFMAYASVLYCEEIIFI